VDYRLTNWPKCRHPPCFNAGRYSSGYCGIHDIEFNEGNGTRVAQLLCAECGTDQMTKHYQGVPGRGNLCLACWGKYADRKGISNA